MSSDSEPDPYPYPIPKLPLFSMTPHISEPSGMSTPPLQTTAASVPFRWEEHPGKPRPCTDLIVHTAVPNKRQLDLPPRLAMPEYSTTANKTSSPSPTTVLDGPGDLRPKSFFSSSFRFPIQRRRRDRRQRSFDSNCSGGWSPADDDGGDGSGGGDRLLLLPGGKIERRDGRGGLFGSFRLRNNNSSNKLKGDFVIPPLITSSIDAEKGKKMRRNSSMSKVSGSHFWAKIYKGFKQVVPWRMKPKIESFIL